jgi:5-bromo-4-chloroindolyl phosphate hydrolysis protein
VALSLLDKEAEVFRADLKEAVKRVQKLLKLAKQRLKEVEQAIAEIDQHDDALQESRAISKGLQNPELARYQRLVNRELYEAIDRLESIQQRKSQGFMGSFGQASNPIKGLENSSQNEPL